MTSWPPSSLGFSLCYLVLNVWTLLLSGQVQSARCEVGISRNRTFLFGGLKSFWYERKLVRSGWVQIWRRHDLDRKKKKEKIISKLSHRVLFDKIHSYYQQLLLLIFYDVILLETSQQLSIKRFTANLGLVDLRAQR